MESPVSPQKGEVTKVLHVTGGLEPELGGPAVVILNYIASTACTGVESHLLVAIDDETSPLADRLRDQIGSLGGQISFARRTWRFRGRVGRWGISFGLAKWLARHAGEFDVIVLHGAWMFSSITALAAGRLNGKACILVPHESLSEFDVYRPGSLARIAAKAILKKMYGRHCQLFLFNSDAEAELSFPAGSRAGRAVLHCPLFDDGVARAPIQRRASGSGFRVGFLGRLHSKKNVDVLLEALALLPESCTLTIGGVGDDNARTNLESLASRLGLEKRVIWRGFVSASQKDDFFQSIDVLVMPSEFESFGIVAAEAMMRGVPAVVSPRTGIAELIRETGGGLVVPPIPEKLAEALESLKRDAQLMQNLSLQAIETATTQLSFSRIGSQLRACYLELGDTSTRAERGEEAIALD